MAGEWNELPLSEAVLLNPTTPLKRGTVYPFVEMSAISAGTRDVKCSEHREFSGGGSRFKDRDTLMARITPCLENGKIARFHAPTDEPIAHGSTEFIVVRGKPNVTDNDYAYYLTISPEVRAFAISQMTGTSGRQRVPTNALGGISIPVPPLAEQKAIAAVLGALDDKIELNRRMNATLEAMARALFQNWFVDFDPVRAKLDGRPPAGLDPATAALFPASFQDSPLGPIPHGWTAKSLPEVVDVNPRRTLKAGTIAPYLDMKNLPTQGHSADEVIDREFTSGTKFQNGDTLLARITPCLENGKTGYVDFLDNGQVVGALKCRHARRDVWFDCGDSRVDSDRGSAVVCGRYVSPEQAAVERHWQLGRGNDNPFPARYNVTPQQGNPRAYVPVIRHGANGTPERAMLQWWLLPYWSKEPRIKFSTFNARTDKVSSAASFRVPFRKRRCLIPTLGWFEWQATPQGKVKWWLHRRDRDIVSFAGLWDRWHRGDEVIESCTIIVGEANNTVRHIHDRMPVIIEPKDEAFWLDTKIDTVPALEALLQPASEDAITAHTVRSEKRPSDEDATLIDPVV